MKKSNIIISTALAVSVSFNVIQYCLNYKAVSIANEEKPTYFLKEAPNIDLHGPVRISGQWKYYRKELL